MNDSTFGRLFIGMMIILVVLTIIVAVAASFASTEVNAKLDERSDLENTQATALRIAPVGKFSATTIAAAPISAAIMSVEDMYTSCSACHASGVLSAPIMGDAGQWAGRIAKGTETLYSNAINGFNAMPARGGNSALTDDNVKAIVDYMIAQSK
ncbi:MAG: cytochrome c5 family protein [Arenicella sp.]|nr:cytochrome c5 family protein [Arenicella sp.]